MIKVSAPSNIAFLKYWGKRPSTSDFDRNIGLNPSLSMTLNRARTFVEIESSPHNEHAIWIEGHAASPADRQKILQHITRVEAQFHAEFPQGAGYLQIRSHNNFPPSAGIASSASAFAALTLGICASIIGKARTLTLLQTSPHIFSSLARRGSGSAARSVQGGYLEWDGDYAHQLADNWPLRDTIVILSRAPKTVSSSEGHRRALTSPHFAARQAALPARLAQMKAAIQARDLHTLGAVLEPEALEMHHIAETSEPPITYLNEESRRLVRAIQQMPTKRDFYFTIDAGPNLHLISTGPIKPAVEQLLADHGIQGEIWEDTLGTGPTLE